MNHRANRAIEKAPGACDSKGLTTYTNAPDFATPEPQGKAVIPKPDKAAIKEALKAGRHLDGAQLLSRRSWRIH